MIGFKFELRELRTAIAKLRTSYDKVNEREALHKKMRQYQRKRWMENLYNEGAIYGPWQELTGTTQIVRVKRGFNPDRPILFQTGGGGRSKNMATYLRRGGSRSANIKQGGMLHAWVKDNILADVFINSGAEQSTLWTFTATGAKDGSYAVYHDTGYTTSPRSMIPNKHVPSRRVFGVNDDDRDAHLAATAEYVDKALAAIFI